MEVLKYGIAKEESAIVLEGKRLFVSKIKPSIRPTILNMVIELIKEKLETGTFTYC